MPERKVFQINIFLFKNYMMEIMPVLRKGLNNVIDLKLDL